MGGWYHVDWYLFCLAVHPGAVLGIANHGHPIFGNYVTLYVFVLGGSKPFKILLAKPNPADEFLSYLARTPKPKRPMHGLRPILS